MKKYLFLCNMGISRSDAAANYFLHLIKEKYPSSVVEFNECVVEHIKIDNEGRESFCSTYSPGKKKVIDFVINNAGISPLARNTLETKMLLELDVCFAMDKEVLSEFRAIRPKARDLKIINLNIPDVFPPPEFVFSPEVVKRYYPREIKKYEKLYAGKNIKDVIVEKGALLESFIP